MTRKLISFLLLGAFFLVGATDNLTVSAAEDTPSYCSIPLAERSDDDGYDYDVCSSFVESNNDEFVRRYYKEDGIWYGIIEVDASSLNTGWVGWGRYVNVVGVRFTRDTSSLKEIEIDYTVADDSCSGWLTLLGCIGGTIDPYSDTEVIFNESDNGTLLEFLSNDDIVTAVDGNTMEYYIYIYGDKFASVDIVRYIVTLTPEEIDAITIDIQEQYDDEVEYILGDEHLNYTEKQLALDNLNTEYGEFVIEYDEDIEVLCIDNPNCHAEDETVYPELDPEAWMEDWGNDLLATVGKVIAAVIGVLFAGGFLAYLVYRFALKGFEGTGHVLWYTTKQGAKSGSYWGNQLGNGFVSFFKYLFLGIKAIATSIKAIFTK